MSLMRKVVKVMKNAKAQNFSVINLRSKQSKQFTFIFLLWRRQDFDEQNLI